LTNDGAIRMQNLAVFGYPFLTNTISAVAASGTLTEIGTNVVKKDKITIGTTQYMFVSQLTNSIPNQVAIVPSSFDSTLNNLIAAINQGPGTGTAYSSATASNAMVVAGPLINHAFTVTAVVPGVGGNSIATSFTPSGRAVNLSWGGQSTLFGGTARVSSIVPFQPNTAFINDGMFFDQGSIIYSGNFENSGVFSNGIGSFTLQ
jgi:hypothetical protein